MNKLLVLLFLVTILFLSSGQTYEQQSLIPTLQEMLPYKPLETQLAKLEIPYWGKTVSIEQRGYYRFLEFIIRKGAHFFLFGFVAVAVYFVLPKKRFRVLLAGLSTFIIACTDEYRQLLTGGRTPTWHDVFLDMCGAITFLGVLVFMEWIQKIRRDPSVK
ncbi:VanZ family protein [Psychrobacillus sp. FSL H8-0483]|uniref:VanZ family protein n=1 Tax=Psychrobacillus sp. FSL H8-0483 TaxID=2921389 RepID=UPI00315A29E8